MLHQSTESLKKGIQIHSFPSSAQKTSRCQKLKNQGLKPATEFGLGIMREEDVCGGYGIGPSGEWLEGCGGPDALADVLDCCCCWSVLDGVSAGVAVALLESSSATGEHVSARTLCAKPWRPLPLRLPSLLHSRLEPLRSSFSEELVMVAVRRKQRREWEQVTTWERGEKYESNVLFVLWTFFYLWWDIEL